MEAESEGGGGNRGGDIQLRDFLEWVRQIDAFFSPVELKRHPEAVKDSS